MHYKKNQIKILDKYLENQGKEASDISAPSSTSKSDINKRKPDISASVRSKEKPLESSENEPQQRNDSPDS